MFDRVLCVLPTEEGKVDFEKFCSIVMPFLEEDDDEAMHEELKEAFRLYDKGGECMTGEAGLACKVL